METLDTMLAPNPAVAAAEAAAQLAQGLEALETELAAMKQAVEDVLGQEGADDTGLLNDLNSLMAAAKRASSPGELRDLRRRKDVFQNQVARMCDDALAESTTCHVVRTSATAERRENLREAREEQAASIRRMDEREERAERAERAAIEEQAENDRPEAKSQPRGRVERVAVAAVAFGRRQYDRAETAVVEVVQRVGAVAPVRATARATEGAGRAAGGGASGTWDEAAEFGSDMSRRLGTAGGLARDTAGDLLRGDMRGAGANVGVAARAVQNNWNEAGGRFNRSTDDIADRTADGWARRGRFGQELRDLVPAFQSPAWRAFFDRDGDGVELHELRNKLGQLGITDIRHIGNGDNEISVQELVAEIAERRQRPRP